MKVTNVNWEAESVLIPEIDNVLEIPVLTYGPPEGDLEAANKEYLDQQVEDLKTGSWINDVLPNNRVPRFVGPEISTPDDNTLELKDLGIGSGEVVGGTVDSYGRITNPISKISSDFFTQGYTIPWNNISDLPNTLEGFNITDVGSEDSHFTVYSDTTTELFPIGSRGPVPIEHLIIKLHQRGVIMLTGDRIVKHTSGPQEGFLLCNGATIMREDYPELVTFLTGSDVTASATLPDTFDSDKEQFHRYGIPARTYIKL